MANFNEEDRQWLYDTMKSNGIDTGSYDDFKSSLDNEEDRQWYYDKGKELGLDLGTKQEFDDMMWERNTPAQTQAPAAPASTDTTQANYTFTEAELGEGGDITNKVPANQPNIPAKYGTPEYAQEVINDDLAVENPYRGMTRQQAINAIGEKYRNEWYGKPDAYQNIQKELAAYNIASPEDYGHITAAVRNHYVDSVARQRVEDILSKFGHVNGMTLDDIQGIMDSRDMQQAIESDMKHLGIQSAEDAYDKDDTEGRQKAREEYEKEKEAYYQNVNKQLQQVLVDKYGYLPTSDGRSHATSFANSLFDGSVDGHEERIRKREALDMMQSYVESDINETFKKYDAQAQKEFEKASERALKSYNTAGTSATGTASMIGSDIGKALYAQQAKESARDYDKIIKDISDRSASIFEKMTNNDGFLKEAKKMAEFLGISPEEYVAKYVVPGFMDAIQRQFTKTAIAREMPKDKLDYIMRGLEDSVVGMLISSAINPKSKIAYRDMANARYGEDAGMWLEGARMAVGMASDFWLWGGWGKIGASATKSLLNMRIMNLAAARGISREAATRMVEEEAKQYLSKRVFNQLMSHMPSSMVTMGGAQASTELVRGTTRGEDDVLLNTVKTGLSSAATGAAFGATGAVSGSITSKLAGWKRLLGKVAGLEVEAGTLYTTEELQKMMAGEDAFQNPYEGMLEANVKLGFIKASANPIESARKLWNAVTHPVKTIKGMAKPDLGTLDEKDVKHIMESAGGKDLLDALTSMRPQLTKENAEREGNLTEEEVLKAAEAYKNFMADADVPWDTKQKVARLHGAIVPPAGYEVSTEIKEGENGETLLITRDLDGQCIRELHFDNPEDAEWERDKINGNTYLNRVSALQERIDAYDAQKYYSQYLTNEYAKVVERMQQEGISADDLTPDERQCIYLYQHANELQTARDKMMNGQELTPAEKQLVDIYQKRFIGYTLEGHGHEAFDRQFEREEGLEEGILDKIDLTEHKSLLLEYSDAMEKYLAEKDKAAETAEDSAPMLEQTPRQLEGNAGGEAGGVQSIGANEPSATLEVDETPVQEAPAAEAAPVERNERRQAAYDMGKQAVVGQANLANISYDSQLASLRMQQLFPENDPILSHLRKDIFKALADGNHAEVDRLMDANAGYINARQREAIEQYRDAVEASAGISDGIRQELAQYETQHREMLQEITAQDGNITELALADGSTAYYMSGDLNGQSVMVKNQNGEVIQISTNSISAIGEVRKMEDVLAADIEANQQEVLSTLSSYANGSNFVVGQQVDLSIAGKPFRGMMAGYAPDGSYIFQMEDGSEIPMAPQDAQQAVMEANRQKMEAQLRQEKADAVAEQQAERFGKSISGYAEGKPDLTAKNTDPKAAAEYLMKDSEDNNHAPVLSSIESEIARLNEDKAGNLEVVKALTNKEAMGELTEEEAVSLADARRAIEDADARRRKWGEIRQELMDDNERAKLESARQSDIKNALAATKKDHQVKTISIGEELPTTDILMERFEEKGDAADHIEKMMAATKAYYRDNLFPQLSQVRDTIRDYRRGLVDLTKDELADLTRKLVDLEGEETYLVNKQQNLSMVYNSLGRLYAQREVVNLTPHERKMRQLEKETDREKKLKLAKEAYADDEDALAVLNDTEPQDIYEFVSSNIGAGSINWEGIQRGEHYVRGLRDELGKDKKRGIGKGSDTFGFNQFLAPEGQGKGIEEIVHGIAEGSPYSTEDVRNALIDMLTSASKPTDISHRIVDDRIARAEDIYNTNLEREREAEEEAQSEAQIKAEDDAIMEMTGMTPEEYDAFISDLENRLATQDGYKTSDEYFNQLSEEYDRENEGSVGGSQEGGTPKEQGKAVEQAGAEAAGETSVANVNAVTRVNKALEPVINKYNSLAPIEVVSIYSDEMLAKVFEQMTGEKPSNEDLEEMRQDIKSSKLPAAYDESSKKIYIFAENFPSDKAEEGFFHENLHRGLHQYYGDGLREVAEEYWNNSTSEQAEANKQRISEHYADQPEKIKEEYLVHTMAVNMVVGRVDKLIARLGEENQEIINNILKNIGYDRTKEAAGRAAQAGETLEEADQKGLEANRAEGGVKSSIQGLDGYTEKDITDIVRNHFNELVGDDGLEIVDMKVIGSRVWGDADENSDLDVLLEYRGDMSEDGLFNILNDEEDRLTIEGIPVDINPITEGKSGTIAQFLERNKDYDKAKDKLGISFPERLEAAKAEVNTNPTEAEKKAGNYKLGHIRFGGYEMSIENPKGSTRSGVDANGKPWSITMHDTYGYISEKYGADGDHLDFFINDDADLDKWDGFVFIVDQKNEDGSFDEHKVMYGYPNLRTAKEAYLRNYEDGWEDKHVMGIMGARKADFDKWLADSDHKRKPFAEYFRTKNNNNTIKDNVDQLMADVADRKQKYEKQTKPSYTETQLAKMTKSELVNLKAKRKKDFKTNRYLLSSADVAGSGSAKELQIRNNMAQANADMEAIDAELKRKEVADKERIEQMEMGFAMTDRLEDMGIDVITDPSEIRRGRKNAERDNSEAGKLRHFKTTSGEIYGFSYKDKLYIDIRKINSELPMHEYGHLWAESLRKINPENRKSVKDTWEFIKSLNPDLTSEDDIAEEMIAKYSGKRGIERVRKEYERMNGRDPQWKSKWGAIWQNIAKAIQDFWKKVGDYLNIKYESADQVYDQVIRDFANKVNPRKKIEKWLQERDKAYLDAVKAGDKDKAKELFDAALRENIGNGIVPFVAVDGYRGKLQKLAHGVKDRDPKVIAEVADLMTPIIPKDAVLVPAPSHTGEATDMLDLAKAISERTGAPVADVLKSAERGSQYEAKYAGKPISSKDMGITMQGELPEGKMPVVIDNVVDTGNTAEACVQALGKGIVASLADSADHYKHVASLKSAEPVVVDKNGKAVPLSKRFEIGGKYLDKAVAYEDIQFDIANDGGAAIVSMKRPDSNGYDLNDPLQQKVARLKEEAGPNSIVGYVDSSNGDYVIIGNDVNTLNQIIGSRTYSVDANTVRIPANKFDIVSPKVIREGYKMAFANDEIDETAKLLTEVDRRKELASRKESEQRVKEYLDKKVKGDEAQARQRATKAVLKAMDKAGVPYKVVSKEEEREMMQIFSMMNQESVKEFCRRADIRSTSRHGYGRYCVYNMADPFAVPMYHEKLSYAREDLEQLKRMAPKGAWEILDIGYADEVQNDKNLTGKAADMNLAELQADIQVYHGTAAKFDAFDHSHMGEGEGNQAYGYGTYVTEAEGIGRKYADAMANKTISSKFKGMSILALYGQNDEFWKSVGAETNDQKNVLIDIVRSLNYGYGDPVAMIRVKKESLEEAIIRRQQNIDRVKENLNSDVEEVREMTQKVIEKGERFIAKRQSELDFVNSLNPNDFEGWSKPRGRYLYEVNIPDDTGDNYFDWTENVPEGRVDEILAELRGLLLADEKYGWNGQEDRLDDRLESMKSFFGETFYWRMAAMLGNSAAGARKEGQRLASELLSRHGYVGIKYPAEYRSGGRKDGAKNYVIFNEKDAKIVNTIQFMMGDTQEEGKRIMGWSDGKQVYLTEAGLNPNTPLHETTHLWDKWCQKEKPELWQKLVDAMKKTAMWEEISKNPNYRNIWNDDNRMASEVHARLSGAKGEDEFMKAAFKKDTPQSIIDEVKSVLKKFWESILRLFGKTTKTIGDEWSSLDAIIRMPLRDLLNQDFEKVMKVADPYEDAEGMLGYHGSSAIFDGFDLSKVGSGEGQAVSGHGVYVTTSEGTARYYAKVSSDRRRNVIQKEGYTVNGEIVYDPALARAYDYIKKADNDIDKAIKGCEHTIEVLNRHRDKTPFAFLRNEGKSVAEQAMDYLIQEKEHPGTLGYQEEIVDQPAKQLYEVEIPDDTGKNYLDLDKKLTKKQKEDIKRAFLKRINNGDEADYWKKNRDIIDYEWKIVDSNDGTGDAARGVMEQFLPSEDVSKIFSELGYVGSKVKGSDGITYVIYNEGDLKIKKRVEFMFHIVDDKDEIAHLNAEPKEVGYRNVVVNEDGTLGSPMASRLGKKGEGRKSTTAFEYGKWERSDEHPELANENGKVDLIKPDGKSVGGVDYNPYIHIRPNKVNKQFKQAWERPNLIYVETEYPASELNGEYQAEKAAKAVGKHKWGTQGESLILSRWDKPVRMVPWEEVADDWEKEFKGRGVEFDIIPPKLLPILAERGVEILPPHKGMGKACNDAYEAWKANNGKTDAPVEMNITTFKEEKQQMKDLFLDAGWSEDEVDDFMSFAEGISQEVEKMRKDFPHLDAFSGLPANKKREILKANPDYAGSFDYSFDCVKKEATDYVVQRMIEIGKSTHLGVTQIEGIRRVLSKHGYLTPCVMCYVEAKRKIMKQAKETAQRWNTIADEAGLWKEPIGEDRNLTDKQEEVLKDIAKNGINNELIPVAVAQKIATLMLNNPELRGRFNHEWLMTTDGYSRLYNKFANTGLITLLQLGQYKGKGLLEVSPFSLSSISSDNLEGLFAPLRWVNEGGVRQFSYEDARPMMFFDYYQQMMLLQAARAPLHLYTKRPFYPDLFGETGAMINQSLVVDIWKGSKEHQDKLGLDDKAYEQWLRDHAGFIPDGDKLAPYYSKDSFPVEQAIKNVHDSRFGGRVGNVVVAPSDEFIRWALDNDDINQILPYHISHANPNQRALVGYDLATSYDRDYLTSKDGKKVTIEDKDARIQVNDGQLKWNTLLRAFQRDGKGAKEAAAYYVDYCKGHGLTPAFERFADHPNYYKLLIDFRAYDDNGKPVRQRAIKAQLPTDWSDKLKGYLSEEAERKDAISSISNDETLKKELAQVTKYVSMEGEERSQVEKLLTDIYGKDNVVIMDAPGFDKALDDATEQGRASMLRDAGGVVYGFTKDGKIYLADDLFNAHTPLHEHAHIFMKVIEKKNPRLHQRGIELWKDTDRWQEVKEHLEELGEQPSDSRILSELVSQFTGHVNEEVISDITGITDKNWLRRALNWLKDLWEGVKSAFGRWTDKDLESLTKEQFAEMPLRAFYDKAERDRYIKNLRDLGDIDMAADMEADQAELNAASEAERIKTEAERQGNYLMAPDGTHTKLSEKEWITARTSAFKKWMGFDWEDMDNVADETQKDKLARNGEPLEKYVQGYMERPRKPGKPKKKESETMAEYFNRLRLWEQAVKDWPETEAQWKAIVYRHDGSALPDETAINEKWMQKYEEDLAKWKVDNALPADAEAPAEKPVDDDADPLEYMRTMADWRRSEALWKTAPDKRDYEREAEAEVYSMLAQLELRHHPMSYSERMKQAGASLSQLRHAVLTQKRYDKTTVQSVVDFAKNFMSMGFGDNIGRGDLESILTSVKRAVGARSIKDSVDDIMNKLVENHLRNLSNYLEKLTSVKDKRLNPTGVEVQGELDLEGQRAIAEFRRVRAARMTPQDINTRLDELASKIMNDPENRSQWEAEFDGARAALIYTEGVAANKKACADAENAIRDAEREYKNSGRSYAAQQELLESLHKGLTDLLFERIDLYGQLFAELGTLLGDSRERAHDFRESEKLRVFNIHRMAAIDMAGKDANEIHPAGLKQALNNSALVRLPLCTLGTFEQMLKQFASRTPNGEGMLYNHFMRGFVDATNKEEEGLEAAKGMLDAKVSEVYGRKMQWSDLYLKERFMPTLDVTWRDGEGNQHTYTLSQGNMLAIYMWNKMHDGQMKLRKMDIVDSDVNRIAERIDPKLITLADWIQEEFLPTLRTKYNKVHEQEFGAAMAEIENYFPLRIVKDSIQREEDLTADPNADSVLPSTTTGSIIKRTVNAKPLDILNTDALSLVIEHIEEMEKWAAFTHWNKDVNTLLSYNRFKNQVKNMDTIYGSGEELWDTFRAACQMAAGTYRASHVKADKAMTVLAAGVTGAKIAFRPYTALKQLLSAPAFLSDANAENYAKYFMNPKNFFYENFKWGMETLPVLRKRWHSRDMGDTRLSDKTGFGYWHTQTRKWVAQYGMWANGMIDVLTCAAGARAVYETRLANYKKLGYNEAEAREKALQDAAIAYNLTQQSSEGAFVSQIQKDRTLFANMWTVFRNSPAAYTRQSVDAIRNLKRLYSNREDMLHLMEMQFKEDGFAEAQAKSNARAEYKRAIWKNMAKLAVCALVLPWFWELGSKVPYLIFGDDDELKKRMLGDVTRKELISGPTEGLTFGSATSTLIGAATDHEVMEDLTAENVIKAVSKSDVQPLPMFGDMATMFEKFGYDEAAGLQDLVNIACQIGTGVNPKTLTDPIEASIDACRGDMTKAKEIELFIMRVIMVPNESAQNIYLDEIGMDAKSAKELGYDKLAERYADYMFGKNTPMFGWAYSDEAEKKRRESYLKRFDKEVKDRVHLKDDATLQQEFEGSTSQKERKLVGKEAAARQDSDDYYAKNKGNSEKSQKARAYYMSQRSWSDLMEDLELERLNRDAKANGNKETLEAIKEARQDINELISELPDDKESWQRLRERRKQVLDDLRTKK